MTFVAVFLAAVLVAPPDPAESKWSIDKHAEWISDNPVTGSLWGKSLKLESAVISKTGLRLSSAPGEDSPWPERQLFIFLNKDELTKELLVAPEDDHAPHVHLSFTRPGKKFSRTLILMDEYRLRLVVLNRTETEMKMQIHISLPDYQKSYLFGTFTARVEK
jgi:hypothetical protein